MEGAGRHGASITVRRGAGMAAVWGHWGAVCGGGVCSASRAARGSSPALGAHWGHRLHAQCPMSLHSAG